MHDPETPRTPDAIPLAGVIGWPVAHSRSPALHSHWLRRYGIAGAYVPLAVLPEHLGQVLHTLPKAGFVGVNVTIPHKEAVLALADIVTDRAALIGAANTLIFRPGMTEQTLDLILSRQLPDDQRRARAEWIIPSHSLDAAAAAVDAICSEILSQRPHA